MARFWRRRPVPDGGGSPHKTAPEAPIDAPRARPMLAEIIEHVEEGALLLIGIEVRWLNAAARLLFPDVEHPVGRPLVEVVRDHRIDGLAGRARESGLEHAAEVELPGTGRILQVRAVPIKDGSLVLLARDVTRLRYLATVRQQFVANLSHEIRTPPAGLDLAAQSVYALLPPRAPLRSATVRRPIRRYRTSSTMPSSSRRSARWSLRRGSTATVSRSPSGIRARAFLRVTSHASSSASIRWTVHGAACRAAAWASRLPATWLSFRAARSSPRAAAAPEPSFEFDFRAGR